MERQVLRPQPVNALPIILLAGLGSAAGIGLAIGFALVRNFGAAGLMAITAGVIGLACVAYFRNAYLWFDDREIGKANLLGITTKCRLDELALVETRWAPQPTLNFIRKDGSRAFRVNSRLWTESQLQRLRDGLPATVVEGIVRGPYFLVEGHDVSPFSSLRDVETFLEPYADKDIKAGVLRLFRSDGAQLSLRVSGEPRTPLHKRQVVATEDVIGHDPGHLAEGLRSCLAEPPKRDRRRYGTRTMSAEELRVAELQQLVDEFLRVVPR